VDRFFRRVRGLLPSDIVGQGRSTSSNTQSQHAPHAGRGPNGHAAHSARRFARPLAGTPRRRL